jgi:tRNA A-37 threonylcarbamoyl transferase component Bud32
MPSPFPPRCAEKYRATRLLSSGGFGAVYEAVQVALDRPVVVKLLHAELLEQKNELERFRDEARISGTLSHPSIVTMLEHDVEDGRPWIAYELVQGRDLRAALKEGPLPVEQAVEIAVQICGALGEAHAHGVVHRDLKPENVLDGRDGLYKVTDFGAARWSGQEHHTQTGVVLGTPAYIAPEQMRGEVTARSDLYALGCLLFELLAGRPPFVADNPLILLQMQVKLPAPPVRDLRPDVPEHVERTILRAMAKDPAERFATAAEMAAALRGGEERRRRPQRNGPVAPRAVTSPPGARWGVLAALVAGLTGVAAVAAIALATRPEPVASPAAPAVAEVADIGAVERHELMRRLDELGAHRLMMIPEFAKTWDPSPDTPPPVMHRKALELTALMIVKQREADALIETLERASTPWRRVLRVRARAERCLRVLQLQRLRSVAPVMAKLTEAIDKTRLMKWLQDFAPGRTELMEMDALLRDVEEALGLMARQPELARELGYLIESVHSVAGQCAVLIGTNRATTKTRMDRIVHGIVERASPAVLPMAQLLERAWGSVYQHGNAYGPYHAALAAEGRALAARIPAAASGIERLVRVTKPR